MRIEFTTATGDGTNVEVRLLDRLDAGEPPAEAVVDRVWTADHQAELCFVDGRGQPISARQLFEWVEDSWARPRIGGRYGHLHPYWSEREEKRARQKVTDT